MKITGNEPANSIVLENGDFETGLTIRQQFAIEAMQGLLSEGVDALDYKIYTNRSVNIADYLIQSLNEKPNPNL